MFERGGPNVDGVVRRMGPESRGFQQCPDAMIFKHLDIRNGASTAHVIRALEGAGLGKPMWLIAYASADVPLGALNDALRVALPDVPHLGCTSFQGVFTPHGFKRGVAILAGQTDDGVQLSSVLKSCGEIDARASAMNACTKLERELGGAPDLLLMHATPGFEEQLLEGVQAVFGTRVPVFGGSAADDTIGGHWGIFAEGEVARSGVVLAGFRSPWRIGGGFVGGYLPSGHSAVVTRVEGRVVHELDREPAASVYDRWTEGAITRQLKEGGSILSATHLFPLARTIEQTGAMPQRLLSHPERVLPETQSLVFFSRFELGDRVTLMTNTKAGLIPRMKRATERATERAGGKEQLRGGLLVYCGGCLNATLEQADEVCAQFRSVAGYVPFIGVSTFGEQGSFFSNAKNLHGNLMCSAVVFE